MKPTCFDKLLVRCRRESWRGRIRIVSFLHSFILPNHAVVMICEPDGKVGHGFYLFIINCPYFVIPSAETSMVVHTELL